MPTEEKQDKEEALEKFKNLDTINISVFGYSSSESPEQQWLTQLIKLRKLNALNKEEFIKSFKKDVEDSYVNLASFKIEDLDSEFVYIIFFDNLAKKWNVQLEGSTQADSVDIMDKIDLFKTDEVKSLVKRALEVFKQADIFVKKHIMMHIENGDLLEVDETKLEAILDMLNDQELLSNFKKRVYVK